MTVPEGLFTQRFDDMMGSARKRYPAIPEVSLVIENTEVFDVYATLYGGAKIVATSGAINQMAHYFFLLAAQVCVFMGEELPEPARTQVALGNLSEQRATLNNLFLINVFDFILWHELAHIIRGHLDMLNQRGRQSISEIEVFLEPGPEVNDIRALELDADLFAARNIANPVLATELPIQLMSWEAVAGREVTNAAVAAFCAASMFRLFYQMSGGETDVEHPPSTLRMVLAAQSIISQMLPDFEMIVELSGEIVFEAELLFAPIFGGQPAPATGREDIVKAVQLFDPLHEHLKALWPTMEPHAAVKNSAKPDAE
jgi:hypothetical protein